MNRAEKNPPGKSEGPRHRVLSLKPLLTGAAEHVVAAVRAKTTHKFPGRGKVFYHRAESHALAASYTLAFDDAGRALSIDPDFTPAIRLRQRLETQGLV